MRSLRTDYRSNENEMGLGNVHSSLQLTHQRNCDWRLLVSRSLPPRGVGFSRISKSHSLLLSAAEPRPVPFRPSDAWLVHAKVVRDLGQIPDCVVADRSPYWRYELYRQGVEAWRI